MCTVSTFHPMEDVPTPHRKKWNRAVSWVLQRVIMTKGEEEITRALKRFLILPKALLMQSKMRGQGVSIVAARFQRVMQGDWRGLLELLESDETRDCEVRRQGRNREVLQPENREKSREKVLSLLAC